MAPEIARSVAFNDLLKPMGKILRNWRQLCFVGQLLNEGDCDIMYQIPAQTECRLRGGISSPFRFFINGREQVTEAKVREMEK